MKNTHREKAEWIFKILYYQRTKAGRTALPTDDWSLSDSRYDKLADAIKCIEAGEYKKADDELTKISLPFVNGRETAFKLHARMIVEAYIEMTSLNRNGQTNWGGLFTTAGITSGSRQYIAKLNHFVKEGKFDVTKDEFESLLQQDDKKAVGQRLSRVLENFGVKKERISSSNQVKVGLDIQQSADENDRQTALQPPSSKPESLSMP